ncbi:MAG TPA: hypothetical protein VHE35_34795 [Kofleriaceae bacterium]|nr:hypothetical protein [Kofleriaceae bacterium]
MTRLPLPGPRLLSVLVVVAGPAAAIAQTPPGAGAGAGEAVPVAYVPAYAVASPSSPSSPSASYAPGAGDAATAAPPPAVARDETQLVGIDRRVAEDRVADRGYLAPTALVAPAGTTTLTLQMPLAPGGSVRLDRSFTRRLSLGAGVVGYADSDNLVGILGLNGKYQLWHGRRAALAVTASIYNIPGAADVADDGADVTLFVPGVSASICTGDDCRTLVTADVEAIAGVDDQRLPIAGGLSIATGTRRQLIAEVHTTSDDTDRFWFGFVGGRFVGTRWAFDAGLGFGAVRETEQGLCIDGGCSDADATTTDVKPYPFLALSSRL